MRLCVLLLVSVLTLAGSSAFAASDPPGAQRKIDFTVTWVTKGDTAINRTFKGSCQMIVTEPKESGLDGQGANASRQQTSADLAAEMQKCGNDTECIKRVAAKVQSSGVVNVDKNYVLWGDIGCSNLSLTADDKVVTRGCSLGEGGTQCSTTTTTTKGATAMQHCPNCIRLQHDLKMRMTEYRFGKPGVPVAFDEVSQTNGKQSSRKVKVLAYPEDITPPPMTLAGPPQSGKIVRQVPGGNVTFQWVITR